MGTRGLFGFRYNGKYYLCYNHFDSYFSGLGHNLIKEIIKMLDEGKLQEWIDKLKNIIIVDQSIPPTPEEISKLQINANLEVSSQNTNDWYCLLHYTQGSFEKTLDAGYIINNDHNLLTNDIFIEYSYVLNFDDMTFDFYSSYGKISSTDINLVKYYLK
jgi:hypothetical protein